MMENVFFLDGGMPEFYKLILGHATHQPEMVIALKMAVHNKGCCRSSSESRI